MMATLTDADDSELEGVDVPVAEESLKVELGVDEDEDEDGDGDGDEEEEESSTPSSCVNLCIG